jgi:chromosome segregation ATPase
MYVFSQDSATKSNRQLFCANHDTSFRTLKEEIKTKEDRLERNEHLLSSVQQENKKLAEPLKKAKEELSDLQRQLGSQVKQKSAFVSARAKLKVGDKEMENLKWELEVLEQKYERAVSE